VWLLWRRDKLLPPAGNWTRSVHSADTTHVLITVGVVSLLYHFHTGSAVNVPEMRSAWTEWLNYGCNEVMFVSSAGPCSWVAQSVQWQGCPWNVVPILFVFSQCPDQLWAHPAAYWKATGLLSPTVKRSELELDQLPSSAEVKNEWSFTSIPVCPLMAQVETFCTSPTCRTAVQFAMQRVTNAVAGTVSCVQYLVSLEEWFLILNMWGGGADVSASAFKGIVMANWDITYIQKETQRKKTK